MIKLIVGVWCFCFSQLLYASECTSYEKYLRKLDDVNASFTKAVDEKSQNIDEMRFELNHYYENVFEKKISDIKKCIIGHEDDDLLTKLILLKFNTLNLASEDISEVINTASINNPDLVIKSLHGLSKSQINYLFSRLLYPESIKMLKSKGDSFLESSLSE